MYDAGTVTKNGVEIYIKVDTFGAWHAQVGDDKLTAPTKDELVKKIERSTKKVAQEVSVPFVSVDVRQNYQTGEVSFSAKNGTATGVHSGNGNVLGRWTKDGGTFQRSSYDSRQDTTFRPLTQAEYDHYKDLYRASVEARRAVDQWEKAHKIDLKAEVLAALEKGAAPAE